MRRGIALGVLLLVGGLSLSVAGYQAGAGQAGAKEITVDKVEENLFILRGGGGNTAVFVTTDGVVVVDTKLAGWGQPILSKIKELTPKPVTTIINTHSHGDHVSGNVEFPETVEIAAHETTRKNMEAWPSVYGLNANFPNVVKESGGKGLPKRTFTDRLTLGSGNDRVELYYFGRAHTGGDAWVVFPSLRVLHTGDVFPGKNIPIMDKNAGGSGVEFPETVLKAYTTLKDIQTVITGHAATTMTMADLKMYADFTREFVDAVRAAKKAGQSAEDLSKSWKVPEKFAGYAPAQPAQIRNNAQVVMDELP
jgi:glyoxylase-like metal-dependent hydrolase (beta-lactamase superfamily II)